MPSILVSGAIANKLNNGGAIWTRLSWVLGFRQLGCGVTFVEEIHSSVCVDRSGSPASFRRSANLELFQRIASQFGLEGSAVLLCGEDAWGLTADQLNDAADGADLLVNISGHLARPDLLRRIRRKAYVDLDPGYTQLWHAAGNPGPKLAGHDSYFTVGQNLGQPGCGIPTCDLLWRPVRQPVLLDYWPAVGSNSHDRFTTIASWRGPFGTIEHDGRTLGPKVHEFRKFVDLPRRAPYEFEIALDIHPADAKDRELLQAHGWRLSDPRTVASDPESFRAYVQNSSAEFSVAQGIYVGTNSGWFSDRTTRYLASGKPALVQDTDFSRHLPTGEGLIPFASLDEASQGARMIERNYESHSRAARQLAEHHFNSDVVLSRFLDDASFGLAI